MEQRVLGAGIAGLAVLLGVLVVVWMMPGPEPVQTVRKEPRAPSEQTERLTTRVVTPVATPAAAAPPDRQAAPDPDGDDSIPFEERVYTADPLPATYQGVRKLFKDHGEVVQRCLREVAYPSIQEGAGPLPSRVGVVLTVQGVEGTDEGRLTGLEVTGDYDRAFSGFSTCLARRFETARFSAPPAGTVATLTWQQHVPRRPPAE